PSTLFGDGSNGFATSAQERQVEAIWLMAQFETRPETRMLAIPAIAFTLDYIEGNAFLAPVPAHGIDTTRYVVQPRTLGDSAGYSFLWAWDYDGNPYHGMPAMLHRAAAVIALDLIMVDQQHKTRDNGLTGAMTQPQIDAVLDNYVLAASDTNPDCQLPSGAWTTCEMIPPDYQDLSLNGIAWSPVSCAEMPGGLWLQGTHGPQPPAFTGQSFGGLGALGNRMNNAYNFASGFTALASAYYAIRPGLATNVAEAFDQGFVRLAERLSLWGSFVWPAQFNRSTIGAIGLYLVQQMTGSPVAQAAYESYAEALYSGPNAHFDPAGYFRDDSGWDSSYNGLNLQHTCRLARLEQDLGTTSVFTDVRNACHQLSSLRAHLTLRDPDGQYNFRYAPNHFNTRTQGNAHTAQYLVTAGPFNGIVTGDPWAYAQVAGWDPLDYYALNHSPPSAWQVDYGQSGWTARSTLVAMEAGRNLTNHDWRVSNWSTFCGFLNLQCYRGVQPWEHYNFGYYKPSFEALLHQIHHQNPNNPLLFPAWDAALATPHIERYPVERPGDRIEIFDDDFLFAKEGELASMIHIGSVGGGHEGFAGNGFSYLFDDDGGAVVFSRRRSPSGVAPYIEDIADWWRWALHTVWLQTTNGALTTAAGETQPSSTIVTGALSSTAMVSGNMPEHYTPFSAAAMSAPVPYARQIDVADNLVTVTTEVGPASPNDDLTDALETLPLNGLSFRYFGIPSPLANWEQSITVEFETPQGPVNAMGANQEVWFDNVTAIRYTRLGGGIEIELDLPTRVKLADTYIFWHNFQPNQADGTGASQSAARTRNLVFDLLHRATGVESDSGSSAQLNSPVSLTYEIRPLP
ncbi:MAG: hypothetical protein AAF657_29315, partial [Acidobacteriota bacterium]